MSSSPVRPRKSTKQLLDMGRALSKTNHELALTTRRLSDDSRNLIQASRGLLQALVERAPAHLIEPE